MFQNYENIEGFIMDLLINQNNLTKETVLKKLSDRKLLNFILDNIYLKEDNNSKIIEVYIKNYFIDSISKDDKLLKRSSKKRNLLIFTKLLEGDTNNKYKLIDILLDYNSNLLLETSIDENKLSVKYDYDDIKSKIELADNDINLNKNGFLVKHNLYYINKLIGSYYAYEKISFLGDENLINNYKMLNEGKEVNKNNLKEALKYSKEFYKNSLNHMSKQKKKEKVKIRD